MTCGYAQNSLHSTNSVELAVCWSRFVLRNLPGGMRRRRRHVHYHCSPPSPPKTTQHLPGRRHHWRSLYLLLWLVEGRPISLVSPAPRHRQPNPKTFTVLPASRPHASCGAPPRNLTTPTTSRPARTFASTPHLADALPPPPTSSHRHHHEIPPHPTPARPGRLLRPQHRDQPGHSRLEEPPQAHHHPRLGDERVGPPLKRAGPASRSTRGYGRTTGMGYMYYVVVAAEESRLVLGADSKC